jgi:hypothetical protein
VGGEIYFQVSSESGKNIFCGSTLEQLWHPTHSPLSVKNLLSFLADATSVKVLRNLAWARLALAALATLLSAPPIIRLKVSPSLDVCQAISHFMTPAASGASDKFSHPEWTKRLHLFLFKVLDRAAGFQSVSPPLQLAFLPL